MNQYTSHVIELLEAKFNTPNNTIDTSRLNQEIIRTIRNSSFIYDGMHAAPEISDLHIVRIALFDIVKKLITDKGCNYSDYHGSVGHAIRVWLIEYGRYYDEVHESIEYVKHERMIHHEAE